MIDEETKNKFLEELEKSGNVYLSCLKNGIHRSTYYRWKEDDKEFNKKAAKAEKHGRENNSDIGEHALMLQIKKENLGAIKYLLSHNSPIYKGKQTTNVVILHKKEAPPIDTSISAEEHIRNYFGEEKPNEKKSIILYREFTSSGKKIPNKLDGTPIGIEEIISYEGYIRDIQKVEEEKIQKELPKSFTEEPPPNTDKTSLENSENNPKSNSEPIVQTPAKYPQIHWRNYRNLP